MVLNPKDGRGTFYNAFACEKHDLPNEEYCAREGAVRIAREGEEGCHELYKIE